jgi:hypothetical protein
MISFIIVIIFLLVLIYGIHKYDHDGQNRRSEALSNTALVVMLLGMGWLIWQVFEFFYAVIGPLVHNLLVR